jgi:hypothetical protein
VLPNPDICWRIPTFKKCAMEEDTGKRLVGKDPNIQEGGPAEKL